jgi:four helix bundle protein
MAGARHFTELACWQLADQFKVDVYALCARPGVRRDFRFREQFRDAAASAPRNIAEGFGRRSHRDFARLLDVARASLNECQNHLKDACDRGYLEQEEFDRLWQLSGRALAATAALQRYLRGSSR